MLAGPGPIQARDAGGVEVYDRLEPPVSAFRFRRFRNNYRTDRDQKAALFAALLFEVRELLANLSDFRASRRELRAASPRSILKILRRHFSGFLRDKCFKLNV